MPTCDDLLDHGGRLLSNAPIRSAGPSDTDIRRAVSASYYAVFHLLVDEATALLCPIAPKTLPARFRRAFMHKEMRNVCAHVLKQRVAAMPKPLNDLFVDPIEPELAEVALTFTILQLDRHVADYDAHTPISLSDADDSVAKATRAIAAWKTIRDTDNARVFLTALLLAGRWSRD